MRSGESQCVSHRSSIPRNCLNKKSWDCSQETPPGSGGTRGTDTQLEAPPGPRLLLKHRDLGSGGRPELNSVRPNSLITTTTQDKKLSAFTPPGPGQDTGVCFHGGQDGCRAGTGVRGAWRPRQERQEEGTPARCTLGRRRSGSGGDSMFHQSNIRCSQFRAGFADCLRNGCFTTWEQLAGEHAVTLEFSAEYVRAAGTQRGGLGSRSLV